jgi:pimeloyl-ACP methyl ester carboxylesterase
VFVAPMVEFTSLLDQFQQALGFGARTRRAMERNVDAFVGIPVAEFDARVQAAHVEPLPTLVITDRGDRQTPYAEVVDLAATINAPLITTEGLGHRKVLRDPEVVRTIVEFLGGHVAAEGEQQLA